MGKGMSKVLMDRGSKVNILYIDTLDAVCIPRSFISPHVGPFHGVMLGKHAVPLEKIDLVANFPGAYHAILGLFWKQGEQNTGRENPH